MSTLATRPIALLPDGKLFAIEHPAGTLLECLAGAVWITQGDARDVILEAGDRIVLAGPAPALISALAAATTIRTRAPRPLALAA